MTELSHVIQVRAEGPKAPSPYFLSGLMTELSHVIQVRAEGPKAPIPYFLKWAHD